MEIGRFAPTTSGRAHPGTLLAGLLAWLDVRRRGGRFLLRMEDIDPGAQDETQRRGLLDDLVWFGLEWDDLVWQSAQRRAHEAALDTLATRGVLYACGCSRTDVKAAGLPSVAGGWVYPGTCRHRRVTDWRVCRDSLRIDLSGLTVEIADESGADLSQNLERAMGDPVVRRGDGGVTYQLAVVVDDASVGVTRVVRGRDLATSTATQVALRQLLGLPIPVYRHHLLLLEPQGGKLAKLHQSIGADVLRRHLSPDELRGFLAHTCGLAPTADPVSREQLVASFSWSQVAAQDRVVAWNGRALRWYTDAHG
jgi:glutamyl/glutaminyl-tRNA synthetase